jgi:serine protease SohB
MAVPAWLKNLRARLRRAPRVNVLRLEGVIGAGGRFRKGLSIESTAAQIERAFEGPRLKAVAVIVNSPGGSPAQSALIHDRIRALAEEKKVPVIAFVEDVAASGGYWIACAGEEIHVQASSIVGSIGVVSPGFGFVEAIARLGIERRLHASGENKAILDPFLPEKPEDVARLEGLQKEIHDLFIAHVKTRRGQRLNDIDGDLFSGAFWTGEAARQRGLVDGIGDVRQVMRARFGRKVRLNPIRGERGLLARFGLDTRAPWAAALGEAVEARSLWGRFGL